MKRFFAKHLFDGQKWHSDCAFTADDHGMIDSFIPNASSSISADITLLDGYVLPLMPNVHSHAFQRAMAGAAEHITGQQNDSFWTWRNMMYDFAQRLSPDDLYHIAVFLYTEMRRAGYGWVGEFHYLHHNNDGTAYDNPFEMTDILIAAAQKAGIGMTILPALYSYSGFGEAPPLADQKRFIHDEDQYANLISHCQKRSIDNPLLETGLCFHSLRATSASQRQNLTKAFPDLPVHIHIAEQQKEVDDCIAYCGKRPVEYLYDHCDVNDKWTLIHATHLNAVEINLIAQSGAIAGLCPTTEANLGDGLFPLQDMLSQNGHIAIGSDSHISVDPVEELRWLEYGQRLFRQKRSVSADQTETSPATALLKATLTAGAHSMNAPIGRLKKGSRADFMVLDSDHSVFYGASPSLNDVLDRFIFARNACEPIITSSYNGGIPLSNDHSDITENYKKALEKLNSENLT